MTRNDWSVAFVTGAGSGIGLGLAKRLLAKGVKVAVFDLTVSNEVRESLDREAQRHGASARFSEVDVRRRDDLDLAVGAAADSLGRPDLVVNCAGIGVFKAFSELSGDDFERVLDVNLVGSRNFAAATLPRMTSGSRLALTSSIAGIVPNYGYAAYNASKFGVVGLAGALRLEYTPRGIGVSVICPPEVETPMVDEERATGDPIGLELKQFSGTLSVDRACDEILQGLSAGRWMIIPGRRAKLTRRLAQIAPGLSNVVSDRMVARALRKGPRNSAH